jgi:predicted anti-sigma-YlaC factor YlaD
MWWIGGHLGAAVSALVDGQLDHESSERAWAHVATCASCRRLVEREGWVKRQLAEMAGGTPSAPPTDLVGSLYDLEPAPLDPAHQSWAAVEQLERRHRPRRRAAIAAVGVGSVSAAVIGLSTLGAAPLGIGGAPAKPPATSLTRATPSATPSSSSTSAPSTGPFSGWRLGSTPQTGTLPVRSTR